MNLSITFPLVVNVREDLHFNADKTSLTIPVAKIIRTVFYFNAWKFTRQYPAGILCGIFLSGILAIDSTEIYIKISCEEIRQRVTNNTALSDRFNTSRLNSTISS